MAYKHKIIRNVKTGQDICFLQTSKDTNGALLEMEAIFSANSKEPVAHYHPSQHEDFKVLAGQITVRINGELSVLRAGEQLHIAPNTVHAMWNDSDEKAVMNWQIRPALNFEYFFETLSGLAADDKTDANGRPGILQTALTASNFSNVFRIAKPAYAMQKIIFMLLTPFAYMTGYKPMYKQYLD
ncbi:cupin domain-containing protein [Ilyomonas limi]|uniref:Cupin domain-containing protein n=1 Tax=Ilyomonas limi TaxID=2575867 RepID=A0A4U3LA95_9BACT|nr:cupin domain-containing protein [Ilyomonas limi]TKK70946.1 cupin domain-containing protein [Ilyomonas limi]